MTGKNILLISANQLKVPYPVYPLGISYIAASIRKAFPGFELKLCDLNTVSTESLLTTICNFDPAYIGISIRNLDDYTSEGKINFLEDYRQLIKLIRSRTKAIIIIGGAAFSIYPLSIFDNIKPDYGICSGGEKSVVELINCLENKQDFSKIKGLVFRKKGRTVFNKVSLVENTFLEGLKPEFEKSMVDYYWHEGGMLNIQTKRGCPRKCIYCTYPLIEGNRVKSADPDSVIETIGDLYFNHNIKYFFFTDSVFNLKNDFNIELAEKLIRNNIQIKWGAYFSPKNLNLKLLKQLSKAGLKHIEFGTDSLSNSQLINYRKNFNVSDVIKSSELCFRAKIYFSHFLILGGYGETEGSLAETFENSKKINYSVFFPILGMRIYPGTELEKIALQEGVIIKSDNLLENHYYFSKNVDISRIKQNALATGQKWVFPDDDMSNIFDMMKSKHKKGLLWHLIR